MIFRGFLVVSLALLFLSAFKLRDDLKVIKVVAGSYHNCALFSNGKAKCWGNNIYGQLGVGSKTSYGSTAGSMTSLPYVMVGEEIGRDDEEIVDIGTGYSHSCALFKTGKVKCWGYSGYGALGIETTDEYIGITPQSMKALPYSLIGEEIGLKDEKAIKLSVSDYRTCVLFESRKVKCWGYNSAGQIGIGSSERVIGSNKEQMQSLPYVKIGSEIGRDDEVVENIFALMNLTCAIFTNSKAKCWGSNDYGQLGFELTGLRGNTEESMKTLPFVKVGEEIGRDDEKIKKMQTSYYGSCALFESGKVKCWGYDAYANLGYGKPDVFIGQGAGEMSKLPYVLIGEEIGRNDEKAIDLSMGNYHTCVIFESGKMKCWGYNATGALGLGVFSDSVGRAPDEFKNLLYVYIGAEAGVPEDMPVQVTSGVYHSCVLYSNGKVQCWGNNDSGQLGVDDDISRGKFRVDEEGMSPYVKF